MNRLAFFAVPLTVLLITLLGPILRDGMFIDGLVYTNLAKNMARGHGGIWEPVLNVGGPVFTEHPVLLPYLHSFLFSLLGDGKHTEDVFNFLVVTLTVGLMYLLWRKFIRRREHYLFFFPLLLWALSQEVQLRYANTMLECGMTVFLLAGTYAYFRLGESRQWLPLIAVGLATLLATLSKGPVGLFLLGLPFFHELIMERRFRLLSIVAPVLILIFGYGLLFALRPEAYAFLHEYFDAQVLAALRGDRIENIANSRFAILQGLVLANLPALILSSLLLFVRVPGQNRPSRAGWLFVAVGATAVLPIMASIKQASYYQLPSLPFLFLGLGLLLLPRLVRVTDYFRRNRMAAWILRGVGMAGLVTGLYVAFSMLNTTDRRDRVPLARANEMSEVLKKRSID
ncbi:MAG: glycosyltransferase family 39 protein, partial [Bacteroidota bacterium]